MHPHDIHHHPWESVTVVDTVETAEALLNTYNPTQTTIHREPYPNESGLYARITHMGRIGEDKLYIG